MAAGHLSADVSIRTLGEAGDLGAVPGSLPWAIAVRLEVQKGLDDHQSEVGHLAQMLHLMRQHEGYKRLYDRQGRPFPSYPAFCVEPKPWGLGEDPEHVAALLDERLTAQERAQVAAPLAQQQIGQGKPGPGRGQKTGAVSTRLSRGSTKADYLTARIARDRPDILERMKAGEFKSVRAAAIEAGIMAQTVAVPREVGGAARALLRHFSADQIDQLVALLVAARDKDGVP